ncbi:hypothetical protein D6774_02485 [Candidatus Woesearchaeota archaeon]|nr:MAG: hypothetical protein D6774_02485 [Candidatus Woesearchaeota archaeon]
MLSSITTLLPLSLLEKIEFKILSSPKRAQRILTRIPDKVFTINSQRKAVEIAQRAIDRVPAYATFLADQQRINCTVKTIEEFEGLPITTKENYVKKYGYESRCVGGKFPLCGNIDESSGSSGKPTNWIRARREEDLLLKAVEFEYVYTFKPHHERTIILSAWSSGPWATGVKFCELMEHFALVKNTGTDPQAIIETLETFGPGYEYIIAGYPLFLQKLFDENKKFAWKDFTIHLLTGGDSNPPKWREHFNRFLQEDVKVISSYGCSDIDIGIGFETPISQFIRELCVENPDLREELFEDRSQIPMLFQYNPLMHYIENITIKGQPSFCVTLLDPHAASPKVRYSVEDRGGVREFSSVFKIVRRHEPKKLREFLAHNDTPLRLPFLFVGGRVDGTLSFDGANVFPEQVAHALSPLRDVVNNFVMKKKGSSFLLQLELRKGARRISRKRVSNIIGQELSKLNRDYAESLENNHLLFPQIEWFSYGTGPFRKSNAIKFKRIC